MQNNILRNSNTTKIILEYSDRGLTRKFNVKLRFMDQKECYFAIPADIHFVSPKRKTKMVLVAYTEDGVYNSKVVLLDTNVTQNEFNFVVSMPKKWDFIQMRASTRKKQQLPLVIKYNDGFVVTSDTYDISLGGISIYHEGELASIYKKVTAVLTLQLPPDLIMSFPDGQLVTEIKYVRSLVCEDEYGNKKQLCAFKFVGMKSIDKEILKNYLISIV
ncbi:PilZ domain-containing protein [bacterium]|nr:PilZ domain-containing protein [bacterium]